MNDINELNEQLAIAMGLRYDVMTTGDVIAAWPHGNIGGYHFDYRDPAIALENLKWLLNNGFGVPEKVSDDYEIYRRKGGKIVRRIVNAEFEAAVAYAHIEASKADAVIWPHQ